MPDLQEETLRLFLALRLHRPEWGGSLLLGVGLEEPGRALALASLAAGAAALFVEPDTVLLRAAQREGCCTFTVTSLAEAIRILKNEVRQRRAITVALRCLVPEALREMLQRGLQPQAVTFARKPSAEEVELAAELRARGADPLAGFGLFCGPDAVSLEENLRAALADRWTCETDHADTRAERAARDAEWISKASGSTFGTYPVAALAAHWLQVAPSLFPRAPSRAIVRPQPQ